jgi:hypothetical protein
MTKSTQFSDEELMAFADGEADGKLSKRIQAATLSDSRVANRVALFRSTSQALKHVFPVQRNDEVDEKIVAAMENAQRSQTQSKSNESNVVQFPKRNPIIDQWWKGVAAAAIILGFGLSTGYMVAQQVDTPVQMAGQVNEATAQAFNTVASGEYVTLQDGKLTLVATFKSTNGEACREYEIENGAPGKITGLACKHSHGWHVVAQVFSEADGNSFAPASGVDLIDSFVARANLLGPLAESDEKTILKP